MIAPRARIEEAAESPGRGLAAAFASRSDHESTHFSEWAPAVLGFSFSYLMAIGLIILR